MNQEITIIIPTYNSVGYIKRTLGHLIKQKDQNFEVLIIDDNSKDETLITAKKFRKKMKLKAFAKPKNVIRGAAASINLAARMLNTKYCALIDSDAYLLPNWVGTAKLELKEKAVVGAPIFALKENGLIAYLAGVEIENRYRKIKSGKVGHLSTCNLAMESQLLKKTNLNEQLNYAYDHEFSFKLKKNGVPLYLTKKTACFHVNKRGLKNYLIQQFRIAKYHTLLSKKMKKEAATGDEISPNYLILQPLSLFLAIVLSFFFWPAALIFLLLILALNFSFLACLASRKELLYIPLAGLLMILKNFAWVFGGIAGLLEKS